MSQEPKLSSSILVRTASSVPNGVWKIEISASNVTLDIHVPEVTPVGINCALWDTIVFVEKRYVLSVKELEQAIYRLANVQLENLLKSEEPLVSANVS